MKRLTLTFATAIILALGTFAFLFVLAGSPTSNPNVSSPAPSVSAATNSARSALPSHSPAAGKTGLIENYGRLPLSFEANQGQTDSQVKFLSRGRGYALFLTGDEAVLSLRKPSAVSGQPKFETRNPKFETRGSKLENGNWKLGGRQWGDALEAALGPLGFGPLIPNPASFIPTTDLTPNPESLTPSTSPAPAVLRMKLVGANPAAKVSGTAELPGKSNYFIGNDPKKWRTNVANYAKVKYQGVYPGIDLVYYGNQQQLEYDFVVAPGGDPRAIRFEIVGAVAPVSSSRERDDGDIAATEPHGADTAEGVAAGLSRQNQDGGVKPPLRIDPNGDLLITTEAGEVRFHKPVVYQPVEAPFRAAPAGLKPGATAAANPKSQIQNRKSVDGRYALLADNRIGFDIGAYDPSQPLIIDPVLSYSTYLGGSDEDFAYGIAVDASGNAYVTGRTQSGDFPTLGAFQTSYGGGGFYGGDAFVAKLNAAGSALVYSTYLGGSNIDLAYGIAVDAAGSAYVAGQTYSSNFPTTPGAFQPVYGGGSDDAFVAKLNVAGSALVYSTYLGGSSYDFTYTDVGYGIAVDAAGNAYVTGFTASSDFPTTPGAFQTSRRGDDDAFVAKLNAAGSALVYSTYLGGSNYDLAGDIAVDASGNAYVSGYTESIESSNFPTTPGAFQPSYGGGTVDAFVTKLNAAGSALVYSTYLGGTAVDGGQDITVDAAGNAYVSGITDSSNFPTTPGAFQTSYGGGRDAFVAKIQPLLDISVSPSSLDFGTQPVDHLSAAHPLSVTNPGEGTLNFTDFAVSGDFALDADTTTCAVGTPLAVGNNCSIGVTFTPTATGTRTGLITITDNAPGSPHTVTPSGFGTQPAVGLSGTSLDFGDQRVGTSSTSQPVTLSNTGNAPLTLSSIAASGDFAETSNCGDSVTVGGNCTISVTLTATATGARSGVLTITDDAPGSPHTVTLSGTGIEPAVSLAPPSLNFGNQRVGRSSAPQTVTLTNTGTAPLNITSMVLSNDYSQTNTCGSPLAVAASCTINVTFSPTTTGARSGSLTITDDAPGSPHTVALSGNGTQPRVSLTPESLDFGEQRVGTRSASQPVTLSNTGTATLHLARISITGADRRDFAWTGTCGARVAAGANCTLSVTFKPSAAGNRTGAITITDDAPNSPQTVALSGNGTQPRVSLTPGSLDFGGQRVGTTSGSQPVTLSNTGTATLNISRISITGADRSDFAQTNTCGASVAAGANCTLSVTFKPTTAGSRRGAVTITDDAPNSPQTVALSGMGTRPAVSLSPTRLSFPEQVIGTTSTPQTVRLTNSGTATLNISSISIMGADRSDFAQTNTCGASVAAGANCTLSVTFKPTAAGRRTGAVTITDDAPNSPQAVALSGTALRRR
jgi:hypothetical protein